MVNFSIPPAIGHIGIQGISATEEWLEKTGPVILMQSNQHIFYLRQRQLETMVII